MLTDDDKKWIAAEFSTQIADSEVRMGARMEKIETALLTEFHKWASPVITRLRSHSDAMRTLDLEMEALQSRVDKLESK
jgi:phage shock protein A